MEKNFASVISVLGWAVGLVALVCAGGALDGRGTTGQIALLGLVGIMSTTVAVIAQKLGEMEP